MAGDAHSRKPSDCRRYTALPAVHSPARLVAADDTGRAASCRQVPAPLTRNSCRWLGSSSCMCTLWKWNRATSFLSCRQAHGRRKELLRVSGTCRGALASGFAQEQEAQGAPPFDPQHWFTHARPPMKLL